MRRGWWILLKASVKSMNQAKMYSPDCISSSSSAVGYHIWVPGRAPYYSCDIEDHMGTRSSLSTITSSAFRTGVYIAIGRIRLIGGLSVSSFEINIIRAWLILSGSLSYSLMALSSKLRSGCAFLPCRSQVSGMKSWPNALLADSDLRMSAWGLCMYVLV